MFGKRKSFYFVFLSGFADLSTSQCNNIVPSMPFLLVTKVCVETIAGVKIDNTYEQCFNPKFIILKAYSTLLIFMWFLVFLLPTGTSGHYDCLSTCLISL
ncbi:unnamed protein product [Musa textilis]